ncbi:MULTISPECIES: hypothetical protein [unclassified Sinorhizobium]|uniref:hypothetical protein n=1 Tax=unclassified Sinorhizobium TaxID=2613772 RepID=UPI0035233FF8
MWKFVSPLTMIPRAMRRVSPVRVALHAVCAIGFLAGAAAAQQPTEEQRNEVRAACRSDFMAQCSGVTPGGMEALTCLQQHSASLSAACRKAVSALTAKPKSSSAAPAQTQSTTAATPPSSGAAQPTQAQQNAVKSACRSDFMAQCAGVTPGGAAALSCLQQHSASLSPSCQQAVAALGGAAGSATPPAAGGATTAMPTPTPRSMPAFSPREELFIAREACGSDFRSLCGAVPLGGGRAIACLRDNLSRVSPACHKVLTSGL